MTDNVPSSHHASHRLGWSWFPSLIFGDGMLPSVLVMTIVMLHRLGYNNAQTALYMALLCIPLVLRPLFEMIVTHFHGTTKVWILSAEFISAISLWAIAFIIPTAYVREGILCILPFFVVAGVFYNTAMNRFYIESSATGGQYAVRIIMRAISLLFGIGAITMIAGNMEVVSRNVRYSWSLVLYIMAGTEFFLWLWHSIFLPHHHAAEKDIFGLHTDDYTLVANHIASKLEGRLTLYFFPIFVLPLALSAVVTPLLLVDAPHNGGLGLSPQEFGLTFGTIGVIAAAVGYAAGEKAIRLNGVCLWIIPLTVVMSVHPLSALYLSYNLASPLTTIGVACIVGGLGLGLGMAAYMSTIRLFATAAKGEILRRAVAISLIALTMVVATTFSGLLETNVGYRQFFTIVVGLYTAPIVASILYALLRK